VLQGDRGLNGASFDTIPLATSFRRSPLKGPHVVPPVTL
jgi:hypothetical protein